MDKNSNFEKIETKVLFYREGKNYYFKFNNKKYECNSMTINKLKEQLLLPYKISFHGMSRAQFEKVLLDLLDNNTDFNFQISKNKIDNILKFDAVLFEKKRIIEAYKVSNSSCLYGRSKICNPYILTSMFGKVVLLEVPKDYIKINKVEYYFLASDLTETEKDFFCSCYTQINCDYVYNLKNYKEKQKSSKEKINIKELIRKWLTIRSQVILSKNLKKIFVPRQKDFKTKWF